MSAPLKSLFDLSAPRVFTIPPGVGFLDTLAQTLVRELDRAETPFALSDAIILLPTRRAARSLGLAFLDARAQAATLLPRIRTLGDLDPDDAGLAELGPGPEALPVIDGLSRKLILARLIRARDKALSSEIDWSDDPSAALNAAQALADLLDSAAMTGLGDKPFDWSQLETLVQDKEMAQHWEVSTNFLKIVTQAWPAYLEGAGLVDPGARQRQGIEGLIAKWQESPPKGAVILAGSTGSMPVTRALMKLVAGLPMGAVVLPGLDKSLEDSAWAATRHDDQHPQRALAQTLEDLGLTREDVPDWPGSVESFALGRRRVVLNEALTPQASTADWLSRIEAIGKDNIAQGLENLSLVEAASEEEEANIIALELREVLQTPGQTAALVTPDNNIARRVAAKLARWDVAIDVSAGRPLSDTPTGTFLRLVATWAIDPAEPVALTALLNHPMCACGQPRARTRQTAGALEIACLRGARKDKTLEGLSTRLAALADAARAKNSEATEDLEQARTLIGWLQTGLEDAGELNGTLDISAKGLVKLCEHLASTDETQGAQVLWSGEAGEAASVFLSSLMQHGAAFDPVPARDLPRTLETLLAGKVVRPRGAHPRLAILGPLEARLIRFDKIILAGLDEGVWPATAPTDPFLSRPMREALGLPSPDLRIGLSAHDFAQLAAAPRVVLTRAARRGDAPAVPSRWLWRLRTLVAGALGAEDGQKALSAGSDWQQRLRAHEPERTFDPALAMPRPKPPVHARPMAFSATQIETWIRDPYKLYAQKVLGLKALIPIGGNPGSAERGSAIHEAVEIIANWTSALPDDPERALYTALRNSLQKAGFDGVTLEAELARLAPSITWLAHEEGARLKAGWRPFVEKWGETVLETKAGPLRLFAKADRIDVGPAHGLEILDFKTGTPPSEKQIKSLLAAQLPATALIVQRGGFAGIPASTPTDLRHIRLGGRDVGNKKGVHKDVTVEDLIKSIELTLVNLAERYGDADMPYLSKPRVAFNPTVTYDDPTDRLARRAEWANAEGEEG